jgi:hypothetical protein
MDTEFYTHHHISAISVTLKWFGPGLRDVK